MVGRKSEPPAMRTRMRSSASDSLLTRRPKRNISPKNYDDSSGLSWREERELKRALYASLQESRRQSRDELEEGGETTGENSLDKDIRRSQSSRSLNQSSMASFAVDESSCSQDSMKSFRSSHSGQEAKKNKIHAQRKFAQGSVPSTPTETPQKPKFKTAVPSTTPMRLFPQNTKTEDFLTFLCFRGTSVLPPHLDLFNISQTQGDTSQPGTVFRNGRQESTRESSPASSSTSFSRNNEESVDIPVLTPKMYTPDRKAARASASTPETARGFVGLRSGLHRKSSGRSRKLAGSSRRSQSVSPSRGSRQPSMYKLTAKSMKKSPGKMSGSDRLSLKKKAMATLTGSKLSHAQRKDRKRSLLRSAVSESSLLKRKGKSQDSRTSRTSRSPCLTRPRHSSGATRGSQSPQKGGNSSHQKSRSETNRRYNTDSQRKRKSVPDVADKKSISPTPPKRTKLRTSKRVKVLLKRREKMEAKGIKPPRTMMDDFEFHPRKKLNVVPSSVTGTSIKKKGPVTRASSHLKSVVTSAKLAANKKLQTMKKLKMTSSRDGLSLAKLIERKRHNKDQGKTRETKGAASVLRRASGAEVSSPERSIKLEPFPEPGEPAAIVDCPIFYPTDDQFREPMAYIQSISPVAEQYGMCKVVPPSSWKMESKVLEEIRFMSQMQYVHKLFHRWGPNTKQMECIKKHFESTGSEKFQIPHIGGIELDLVKLHDIIMDFGGMQHVNDKKKWHKVADAMRIPKLAQDRATKLYQAYCKFLLSFGTLSKEERQRLEQCVEADRQKIGKNKDPDPCTARGRAQPLNAFSRVARNTQAMFGRENNVDTNQIECDFWKIVEECTDHIAVQGAKLDTSICGSMFPVKRDNQYSRHPWNLHNFVQQRSSLLHHLGLIADVTVPTLHLGMLYTTSCWSTDNHYLPYIQYLHHGADIIWYSVPQQGEGQFKTAVQDLVPGVVRDVGKWLSEDSVMIPPDVLVEKGVSMSRCVQHPNQFVIVFPKVHISQIWCGQAVGESVHFATQDWIPHGYQAAQELSATMDAEQFSMDAMLIFLALDPNTSEGILALILPYLEQVVEDELSKRQELYDAGLRASQRLKARPTSSSAIEEIHICDISRKICYLSMVLNEAENSAFSLDQGIAHIQKKKNIKHCQLMYRFSQDELKNLVKEIRSRVEGASTTSSSPMSPRKKARKSDT